MQVTSGDKDMGPTSDILCQELGPLLTKISVLAIGPAGENLVRYACPLNDYHHVLRDAVPEL